jgi:hypothetical protein
LIAQTIAFVVGNLPAFLFVAALLTAAFKRNPRWSTPERFLSWILLLPIGVTGLWAAAFHLLASVCLCAAHRLGNQPVSVLAWRIWLQDDGIRLVLVQPSVKGGIGRWYK